MEKYDFKLSPAYCIWNGVAIEEQKGCSIRFVVTNPKDTIFCERLKNSFIKHLSYVLTKKDCPEYYRRIPSVEFVKGTQEEIRKLIQKDDYAENSAYILFDSIICDAQKQGIQEIHIYNNKVFYKNEHRLREAFALTEKEMWQLGERIRELSNTTENQFWNGQNSFFLYGREKPIFLDVSILTTLNSQNGKKTYSYTIRSTSPEKLPSDIQNLGFTESQLHIALETNPSEPKIITVLNNKKTIRTDTIASLCFELKKRKGERVKIISMEKNPCFIIPGIIYADTFTNRQKDDFELIQSIFRQMPDLIIIGDIYDKRNFLFCAAAIKRGISVIAASPSQNIDSYILDLYFLGIPRNEIFSFNNCFITVEENSESSNPKKMIDVAESKYFRKHMIHYTNYNYILAENMKLIFNRKEKTEQKRRINLPFIMQKRNTGVADEA